VCNLVILYVIHGLCIFTIHPSILLLLILLLLLFVSYIIIIIIDCIHLPISPLSLSLYPSHPHTSPSSSWFTRLFIHPTQDHIPIIHLHLCLLPLTRSESYLIIYINYFETQLLTKAISTSLITL